MGSPVLLATIREAKKSENKRLRRENKLPAVVYGKGYETKSIAVDGRELDKILKTHGETSLINLQVEDDTFPVLIKEVQRNTLKNSIDHVDFFKVSMDEEVEYNAPIVLVGDAEGVKMGGVLQHQKREIALKALPRDMLESVEVDISEMKIGDALTVGDIKVDSKNTVLDDPDEIIVSIVAPKLVDESVEAPAEGEEPKLVENDDEE
ncbi:50S ribosomal protein L25/general stress protein Ctc [Tepidanaerobacter sp. GT38]|mgnify:FL=1|uniref:50S ribosomal protein L25/general stress protein Ctc n=1 Tax=Tepidanaerobacter sp. GT38 TaxID=2722793 RepID=UPI001F004EBE|nr:50S ribosomal protein L25/general stress protein Ctc [Tepidanaerobacter sp. GT38]MCG1011957.1 50S ribosomal protein L25/general stress protein Ctc [Tepidanaerobacter sp. GT38]